MNGWSNGAGLDSGAAGFHLFTKHVLPSYEIVSFLGVHSSR